MSDDDHSRPDGRRVSARTPSRRTSRPAAARHGAVSEFLHAAGRGPRELRQADRRGHRRRQADRRLHAEGSDAGRAGPGRSAPDRHADAHPQDVQAARRQPAADRPGPGAHPPRSALPTTRPYLRAEVVEAAEVTARRRDTLEIDALAAQRPRELPAGRAALAGAVRGPDGARRQHHRRRAGSPTSSPRA